MGCMGCMSCLGYMGFRQGCGFHMLSRQGRSSSQVPPAPLTCTCQPATERRVWTVEYVPQPTTAHNSPPPTHSSPLTREGHHHPLRRFTLPAGSRTTATIGSWAGALGRPETSLPKLAKTTSHVSGISSVVDRLKRTPFLDHIRINLAKNPVGTLEVYFQLPTYLGSYYVRTQMPDECVLVPYCY